MHIMAKPHIKIQMLAYKGTKLRSFSVTRPNKKPVTPQATRKKLRKFILANVLDGKLNGRKIP